MSSSTIAPSRWLLVLAAFIVLGFTALRLFSAAALDFRSDEAYYWTWSHEAVLSFLDHPPFVAWLQRLGQLLYGDTTLGARFGQILAFAVTELLIADIARRRTGQWNAALIAVILIEAGANYGFAAIVLEPSVPLLLFTAALVWCLDRLDQSQNPRWWLGVGLAAGLMLLSKYTAVLCVPALIVYLVVTRSWLRTSWPWLAAGLAVLVFSPVLVWNAAHGWMSFAFQASRLGGGEAPRLALFGRYLTYVALFVGLLVPPLTLAGTVALGRRRASSFGLALAAVVIVPLLWFAWRALTLQINQSWDYFVWPFAALAFVLAWPSPRAQRVGVALALPGLALVAGLHWHVLLDRSVWLGHGDPIGQDAGSAELATAVFAQARDSGASWIATTDYRTTANLRWHLRNAIPVVQVNERARYVDFSGLAYPNVSGRALYVRLTPEPADILSGAELAERGTVPLRWRGTTFSQAYVATLDGYEPTLNPAPGTAAYGWAPLVP